MLSGVGILIGSYFNYRKNRRSEAKKEKTIQDKQTKREVEIRLIQRKAAELYLKECQSNGLIIVEAYYGSSQIINELTFVQDKITFLEKNPQKKKKILDVTIPLRFQVIDSSLMLYCSSKKHLFGFYNPCGPYEKNSLFIK